MSWQDKLRPASFRGAAFLVEAADAGVGRRTSVHTFPLRDVPYAEDLGRRPRAFTLKAFVLATPENGMDYMPARDALIAALEEKGPGLLVHPYLGDQNVSCTEASFGETTEEGGKATFILTFVESGEPLFPTGDDNTAAAVDAAAAEALIAAQSDFTEEFTVDGAPQFVSASATDLLRQVNTTIDQALRRFPASPADFARLVPGLFNFTQQLDTLIRTPNLLAGRIVSLYGQLGTALTRPIHSYFALRTAWRFGLDGTRFAVPSIPRTTPTRTQQADNQAAVVALAQRVAVIESARVVASLDFRTELPPRLESAEVSAALPAGQPGSRPALPTLQEAIAVRDELAEEMDRLMEDAADASVYQALTDLHAATVKDITVRGVQLGRSVSYTPLATRPAIVLAYELHEDALRDAEIIARNAVRHPGFVAAGTPIQVLADA